MKTIIILLLLSLNPQDQFIDLDRATTYNPSKSQCDNDPYGTADGSRIDPVKLRNKQIRWVALSRDLINDSYRRRYHPRTGHWGGMFRFGDSIIVKSESMPHVGGVWVVRDCMNARYSRSIDFLFDPINNHPKLGVCEDVKIKKL